MYKRPLTTQIAQVATQLGYSASIVGSNCIVLIGGTNVVLDQLGQLESYLANIGLNTIKEIG